MVSVFVARRGTLHRGQFHLSSPSMISLAMKSSISSWITTLFLPAVIGREMYMNVSYVVDVWRLAIVPSGRSLPCDKSSTRGDCDTAPGIDRRYNCRSAACRSATPSRLPPLEVMSLMPSLAPASSRPALVGLGPGSGPRASRPGRKRGTLASRAVHSWPRIGMRI